MKNQRTVISSQRSALSSDSLQAANRVHALVLGYRVGDHRLVGGILAAQQSAQIADAANSGRECLEDLKS